MSLLNYVHKYTGILYCHAVVRDKRANKRDVRASLNQRTSKEQAKMFVRLKRVRNKLPEN